MVKYTIKVVVHLVDVFLLNLKKNAKVSTPFLELESVGHLAVQLISVTMATNILLTMVVLLVIAVKNIA